MTTLLQGDWLTASLLLALIQWWPAFAAPVSYTYDNLHRLTSTNYGNGQQVVSYTYDDAGNILTRTITVAEQLPPILAITSPFNGAMVTIGVLDIAGTATDTQGASGIASVTVNGTAATGGTATGSATANWTYSAGLVIGTNNFAILATDGSPWANQATENLAVVYLPLIADTNANGLPDVWETANGVTDPAGDADGDGISNGDEYKAGTNPQSGASRPEGPAGINYVYFRDHFNDGQYADRWYLAALGLDAFPTLIESGTELTYGLQQPASGCKVADLRSFATVDATQIVYHAKLQLSGYGRTTVGLMKDQDLRNRVELVLDADASPYAELRSWSGDVLTSISALSGPYQGQSVDVRIIKNGATWIAFVNQIPVGTVTNAGVGDVALRPYVTLESCLADAGNVDSRIDVVELLRDSDADGLADTREDPNANGAADAGESNRLVADSDADTINDGFDNCLLIANADQRDTNGDGYGNICDADLNNNGGIVNFADLALFRAAFGTANADADFNGNGGIVNFADLAIFRSFFGKAPGPSGVAP